MTLWGGGILGVLGSPHRVRSHLVVAEANVNILLQRKQLRAEWGPFLP